MSITIRDAALSDAPTITRFNALMALETENLILEEPRLLNGVGAVLQDRSKGFYCIAEMDGTVVGQLMITYEWSDWRNATFWWIQSVYVEKNARSKGVFRELYGFIEAMARARKDVCGLRLYVEDHNERAQHTYENLGMHHAKYRMMEVDFVL